MYKILSSTIDLWSVGCCCFANSLCTSSEIIILYIFRLMKVLYNKCFNYAYTIYHLLCVSNSDITIMYKILFLILIYEQLIIVALQIVSVQQMCPLSLYNLSLIMCYTRVPYFDVWNIISKNALIYRIDLWTTLLLFCKTWCEGTFVPRSVLLLDTMSASILHAVPLKLTVSPNISNQSDILHGFSD